MTTQRLGQTLVVIISALAAACGGADRRTGGGGGDGDGIRLLLWPALPADDPGDWQDELIDGLAEAAADAGFAAITPQDLRESDDPNVRSAAGRCLAADCAPSVARAAGAQVFLTRTWKADGTGCAYMIRVHDLAEDRVLVEDGGVERRGCTDKGLARPCLVTGKMAIQQAASILERRAALASEAPGGEQQEGLVADSQAFRESLDQLVETLAECGVQRGSVGDLESNLKVTLEMDQINQLGIATDAGAGIPERVVRCVEAKARAWPYPAFPREEDSFSVELHYAGD